LPPGNANDGGGTGEGWAERYGMPMEASEPFIFSRPGEIGGDASTGSRSKARRLSFQRTMAP